MIVNGKRVYTTDVVVEEIDFADTKQKQDNPFTEQPQQDMDTNLSSELPF